MRTQLRWLTLLFLAAPGPARALTPAAETCLDEGLQALYNLDYEAARAKFRQLIQKEPDNPYGYLFESGSIWWQSSNEYGLFKDTPALEGLFEEDVELGLRKAHEQFKAEGKTSKAEAYFSAGMLLGTRGQWNLLRGKYLKAYFDGRKGVKYLNKCVKLDPGFVDAYLGLGIYDYQADRLPGALKLGFLLGVRGDARRGKERMQFVADHGRFAAPQSAQFLAGIYIADERDYAKALPLIEKLRAQFPESPYYRFLHIQTLYRLGDFDASLKQAKLLFEQAQKDATLFGRKQLTLFCGLSGPDCLNPKEMSSAVEWFSRALNAAPEKSDAWVTLLRLYRGISHDVLGQRTLAIDEYQRVLAQPDFFGLHERARRCLVSGCGRDAVVGMLRSAAFPLKEQAPVARAKDARGGR